jgi:TatD DNase family protein
MLVDVHAHLDWKSFDKDLDEVIKRAKENKVVSIITNGVNAESNRASLEIAKKYDIVKPALGIYPTDGVNMTEEELDKEIEFIRKAKPFAIGEVGLDLKHLSSLNKQKKVFERMIVLAEKLKVPLITHTRQAEKAILDTLESSNVKKVILHTFMGKLKLVKRAESLGYSFSIPPIVVNSEQMQKLVKEVSISRLFSETDSPFLSHKKGERNEPMNVKLVVKKIAELKGLDKIEAEKMIYSNFVKMF